MQYFDSHAHYWDDRFLSREGGAAPLLTELFDTNVCGVLNVATSPENYAITIAQAQAFLQMYAALGIHPGDCRFLSDNPADYMEELYTLLKDPTSKAVALGEIGLDYHYEGTNKEKQAAFFHAQMSLAKELDIPVVIHDREAHEDTLSILAQYPTVRGVMHCYSGSAEMAKVLLRHGFYISFTGVITYKNARKTVEVAEIMPRDRVLIETDAPYLTPVPYRNKTNHSGYLAYTCEAVAQAMGITPDVCAEITAENTRTLFGL